MYTWGNINKYYCSYLRINHPEYTILKIFFMLPIGIMMQNTSPLLGGIIDNAISPRLNLIFTFTCQIGCHLLLKYSAEYWVILTAMFLYGFGNGLSYYGVLRNAWKYFPDKRGLLSGIILACFGLSSFVFTSIADHIINPTGKMVDPTTSYYTNDVAERVPEFINLMLIVIAIGGTVVICLICPYKDDKSKVTSNENENEKPQSDNNTNNEDKDTSSLAVKQHKQPLLQAVFSCEFLRLCIMSACTFCK